MSFDVTSLDELGLPSELSSDLSVEHTGRLAACLDQDPPTATLPLLWHFAHFTPVAPTSTLGHDGHASMPADGPTSALPRRMWVGGRIEQLAPLRIGVPAARRTEVVSSARKQGRSGDLLLVTLRHEIVQDDVPAVHEEQDLVFRAPAASAERPGPDVGPPVPSPGGWTEVRTVDPVMLFRFSAVTFNAHRIHYDAPYATDVEGYPGLVVHGPLTAILLAGAAERTAGEPLTRFSFRATAPLFAPTPFSLVVEPEQGSIALQAIRADGVTAMTATAS